MYQNNLKRKIALFVALGLLIVIFFSEIYIITHVHHDCSGNDCPICAQILKLEETIQNIGAAIIRAVVLFAVLYFLIESLSNINQVILFNSPIKMKVRLNN